MAQPKDRTTAYAKSVVAGKTIAGPDVRNACKRHLADLDLGPARGLKWDVAAAAHIHDYFSDVLKLNGGEHENMPFNTLDWQAFILGSLFGWKRADGFRRFRMAYVETGKGSGKSPLAGGIGLYCLTADDEPRAEVYAAASKKDQAQILFRDAVAMVKMSDDLSSRLRFSGGPGQEWNMAYLAKGAFFRTIASEDGQSGPRPHCALLDEIHEHHDATAVEFMRAGTKGRRQALIYMITNSGSDKTGVCYNYHQYAKEVCAGLKVDDSFFAYVCSLDIGDDPFKSEDCWPKVNPSLGHTFGPQYLRELVTQARGMPSKEGVVRRLNFCEWTDTETPWVDRDLWEKCQDKGGIKHLSSIPCSGGLDLSSKRDLTSFAVCWKHPDDTYDLAVWFWTPGDTLAERARFDGVPYALWRDEKHLFAPPGRIINKTDVAMFVQQFAASNELETLAFDTSQIDEFERACDGIGFDVWIDDRKRDDEGVPIDAPPPGLRMQRHGQGWQGHLSQTNLWMPRSIGHFEELIIEGRIRIHTNPVLTWNSASAVLSSDPAGNRKWDKRKATGRIDGIVAAAMAVGSATSLAAKARPSIWDRPELWTDTTETDPLAAALRWIRNAADATEDEFTDTHGAELWNEIRRDRLAGINAHGQVRLSQAGQDLINN